MNELRNAGFLEHEFQAGDNVTDFIYSEIRKRHSGWQANTLHSLQLSSATPFLFDLDGWTWKASTGHWFGSNVIIHNLTINTACTLKMSFRFDL